MIKNKFNVVTDSQWGSCGKGLITSYLASQHRPQILTTTNMANAGHSSVNTDGAKFVAKVLPSATILTKWLDGYRPTVWIGPSAGFTIKQLFKEIEECDLKDLVIHPRAGVITEKHRQLETDDNVGTKHIASTMQGCGAMLAEKIMRKQGVKLAGDYEELSRFVFQHETIQFSYSLYNRLQDNTILHEGAQGFSLDINHGSHYPNCYDPSSLVTVRDNIGNVVTTRMIDVANSDGKFVAVLDNHQQWTKLHNAWSRQTTEQLLAIVCGHNVLTVTNNHPVIVERNGLQLEIKAADVCIGDWVTTPIPTRQHNDTTKHLSESMAYIVGYYLGDGWTVGKRREAPKPANPHATTLRYQRYRNRKRNGLVGASTAINSKMSKSVSYKGAYYVAFSGDNFYYLPAHLATEGYGITIKPYEDESKAERLHVYNSNFARLLDDIGIKSEGASNKRLPVDFMQYGDLDLASILAGYIDSDGCVSHRRIVFGVASLTLCLQWQHWLQSLGIKCLVRPRKKYGTKRYGVKCKTNHWRLEIRFHANNADHPILQQLKKMSAKMHNYKPSKKSWFITNATRERSAFYNGKSKVIGIKPINHDKVCDFTTESGTFVVNGVVGHNCTSRGTTAVHNLADMGLPISAMGDVYLVVRPYPIRVGNVVEDGITKGDSGGCYHDNKETTWEAVAKAAGMPEDVAKSLAQTELTTVTKRLRRVFTYSPYQLKLAARINGATKIALNFANYLDWSCYGKTDSIPPKVNDFIKRLEDDTQIPVSLVGTGPQIDHVITR